MRRKKRALPHTGIDTTTAGNRSSSSATLPTDLENPAPNRKMPAESPTEDLADGMDIMSRHVGPAFDVTAKGTIVEIYSPPRVVPAKEKVGFAPGGH